MATFSDEDDPNAKTVFGARWCEARAKSTGNRCRNPQVAGGVCRLHGGTIPAVRAKAKSDKAEAARLAYLRDKGYFNPEAPGIEDPITAFALHVGQVKWQNEFIGAEINKSVECECCGRAEWDPTILRELRKTSQELGGYLDSMIKHGIYHRALDLEEAKMAVIYKGIERLLYEILGDKASTHNIRRAERIFRETAEPLLRQIGQRQ